MAIFSGGGDCARLDALLENATRNSKQKRIRCFILASRVNKPQIVNWGEEFANQNLAFPRTDAARRGFANAGLV